MFENIIYDYYGRDEVKFYCNWQDYKFGLILNLTNAHKEREYTLKVLESERKFIEHITNKWKEEKVEKVIDYYVYKGKIYLLKRAYYLEMNEIKTRETDFGTVILVNPYIKDKDVLDKLQEKLFEVA